MIGRRAAIAGLAASAPAWASDIPPDRILPFRVSRNGSPIGTHVLRFTKMANGFDVQIAVDIAVSLGPITLYRYTLRGLEQWRDGQVIRLDATTDDDGKKDFARVSRDGNRLWVEGSAGPRYQAPRTALPSTHWNRTELDGPWINPQDGRLLATAVASGGVDTVLLASGGTVVAHHYTVSGDAKMELWYKADRLWTGLRAPGRDGSTILYELT